VTKNLLSQAPQCLGRHVKQLDPAAFAVNTHQPALGPRGGLWPVPLCVIYKEGLCPSSGDINRLMMMMMMIPLSGVQHGFHLVVVKIRQ
jgi:hypothetical protein